MSAKVDGLPKLPRLKAGDCVALAAPAGPVDPARIEGSVRLLEGAGFRVRVRDDIGSRERYLAGPDGRRLEELQAALDDTEVRAVFLARGGYGSQRIGHALRKPAAPKAVVGFSDNTALHGLLNARWSIPSVHGPHPNPETPGELAEVVACLAEGHRPTFGGLTVLRGGDPVEAPVYGGCLALLSASVGTLYMPDFAGAIAFIEDTCEPPYRLDRMLNHLLLAGAFDRAAGVVFGEPATFLASGLGESEALAILEEFASRVGCPVLHGLPSGHVGHNRPLLFGVPARLDPGEGTLRHLESIIE